MTNAVEAAVRDILSGAVEYVQMSIDTSKEIINLEEKGKCALPNLPKKVPADRPRYHLFVFPHTHEGDFLKSIGSLHALSLINVTVNQPPFFPLSLYLHDARVQLFHQGEDAVLELQGQPHRQTGEPVGA